MRKIVSVFILLGLVLSLFACTSPQQIEQTPTSTVKAETPTITPTPVYDAYVVNRARLFAAALTTNDQDLATRMIEYPLTVVSQTGSVQINNGEEFKKIYSALVNSDFLLSFGQPGKGNTVSSRLAGGLTLSEGDFAIVMNGSGMVKEIHNLTVTKLGMESALATTKTNSITAEECYEKASTEDEKLTCAQFDLESSKNTLQALMIEIQPSVEENQKFLQQYKIDYDQIGATQKVQSEWETFGQEQCAWEASVAIDNSANQIARLQCLAKYYKQRIDDLRISLCSGAGMAGECEASWYYKQFYRTANDSKLPVSTVKMLAQLSKLTSTEKVRFYIYNRARLFLTAIATDDKDTALKLLDFPLQVSFNFGGFTLIEDRQQMMNSYDDIFDQWFVDDLLNEYRDKDPLFEIGMSVVDYSVNHNIDVNINGMVVTVINNPAKLKNLDPTPTLIPTRTLNPNDCRDTAMGTYDMDMCFGSIYLKRVQILKNLVKELGSTSLALEHQQLLQAEKEWEQYSSDYCRWYKGFFLMGTIRGVMGSTCMIDQYDQRINNLRLFLCEDHGLSGECEASLRYKPKE